MPSFPHNQASPTVDSDQVFLFEVDDRFAKFGDKVNVCCVYTLLFSVRWVFGAVMTNHILRS